MHFELEIKVHFLKKIRKNMVEAKKFTKITPLKTVQKQGVIFANFTQILMYFLIKNGLFCKNQFCNDKYYCIDMRFERLNKFSLV